MADTRTDAMTVACPVCDAPAGQPCTNPRGRMRNSVHGERMVELTRIRRLVREVRPYDVVEQPALDGLARVEELDGRVAHPIPDTTAEIGLRGIALCRALLAAARNRRTP